MLLNYSFGPSGHLVEMNVMLTPEQINALGEIMVGDEYKAYHWAEMLDWQNKGDVCPTGDLVLRAKGAHYVVCLNNLNTSCHTPRPRYKIQFTSGPHKGQMLVCDHVWHQGEIPDKLLSLLTDNGSIETIDMK